MGLMYLVLVSKLASLPLSEIMGKSNQTVNHISPLIAISPCTDIDIQWCMILDIWVKVESNHDNKSGCIFKRRMQKIRLEVCVWIYI